MLCRSWWLIRGTNCFKFKLLNQFFLKKVKFSCIFQVKRKCREVRVLADQEKKIRKFRRIKDRKHRIRGRKIPELLRTKKRKRPNRDIGDRVVARARQSRNRLLISRTAKRKFWPKRIQSKLICSSVKQPKLIVTWGCNWSGITIQD